MTRANQLIKDFADKSDRVDYLDTASPMLGSDGKPADEQFYQRAQNAVAAEKQYVSEFKETGDQSQVESVAGASLSNRLFQAAIDDAIANAS